MSDNVDGCFATRPSQPVERASGYLADTRSQPGYEFRPGDYAAVDTDAPASALIRAAEWIADGGTTGSGTTR